MLRCKEQFLTFSFFSFQLKVARIYASIYIMLRQVSKGKVFVGLSGGVDSSVSAALLKQQGYNVTGVFIKIWQPEWTECSMKEDRLDAMRVCAHLDIPFKEIDLTEEYKKEVVDYMIAEYALGRTPNPDVMCNKTVKFGRFFDWAIEQGADFVATGHYARIAPGAMQVSKVESYKVFKERDSKLYKPYEHYKLFTAVDTAKDQSYFLWTLTQKHLAKTLFPVGGLKKEVVRKLAKKFGLPTAHKKDSQGLCFVGHVDIKEFLSRYVPQKRGDVRDEIGEIIGYHDGAYFLTLGERHGFTITKKTPSDKPLYILRKDIPANTITVGARGTSYDISYESVRLSSINWILAIAPNTDKTCEAQIRYHGTRYKCRIKNTDTVEFLKSPEAPAAGQSLVLYDGEACLGGGVMESFVV
ncbi:MAG TPA: tRNA 2-thiouridine(34) synthase MnmA [Candidatus Paceibacterota bacterium]